MFQAAEIEYDVSPVDARATRGVLYDSVAGRVLDFVFNDLSEAQQFLNAVERVGVNLYVGMPHNDIKQLVMLWRDAHKR